MIATSGNFAESLLNDERQARKSDRDAADAAFARYSRELAVLRAQITRMELAVESKACQHRELCNAVGEYLRDQVAFACVDGEYQFSTAPVASLDVTAEESIPNKFDYTAKLSDDGIETVGLVFSLARVERDNRNRLMATYEVEFA